MVRSFGSRGTTDFDPDVRLMTAKLGSQQW